MNAKTILAIPVFNEQDHLCAVLDEVGKYIHDVLVIDDGSTDDTKLLLTRRYDACSIIHPNNRGYGQTIIDAFHFAIGCVYDWIITMDCDLQHEPAQIPNFLAAIARDDADVISGSRYLTDGLRQDNPPADRRRINRLITDSINHKLHLKLTDAFCGFKAYRVSSLTRLKLSETGYAFPLQFWVRAAVQKLRILEIPISLIYNEPGRYFGGELDDPDTRLRHYREVFENALRQADLT